MKIQYMSDLHMKLWDNSRYIKTNEFEAKGDIYNEYLTNGFEANKMIEL